MGSVAGDSEGEGGVVEGEGGGDVVVIFGGVWPGDSHVLPLLMLGAAWAC